MQEVLKRAWDIDVADSEFRELFQFFKTNRPSSNTPAPEWKLEVVLDFLSTGVFKTNQSLDESQLLMKTIFLVSLASGCRLGELCALERSPSHLIFNKENGDPKEVILVPRKGFRFKSHRLQKGPQTWSIPAFREEGQAHALCPVSAIQTYLRKSSHHGDTTSLWLHPTSILPLNKNRFTYFFKKIISLSYKRPIPSHLHQMRHLATSLAFRHGLQLEEVCRRAMWASNSVFLKNYLQPFGLKLPECIALGHKIN